jgi:outer membrane protein assembly factor BamB
VALGEARLPTFDDLLKQCDKNGDGRVSWDEADKLTRDVFSILDTNNDKILTRQEWDAFYDIFKESSTGLLAMRIPDPARDQGDLTDTHILWRQKRGIPEASSPLFYHGRVFLIQNGGLASCLEAATGKPIYQTKRIGAPPAQYFASPLAADGKIYVASTGGVVSVIDAEAADALHVLAHNDLGEPIQATPAIVDHTLYVRTSAHLFAFAAPRQ